ncbi:hypothetical protein C8R44DRAFT_741124 [Mycena epipterygia]|nr:hypothetical protein C8R44DRAFT_741124 [Mycena epipterygia]
MPPPSRTYEDHSRRSMDTQHAPLMPTQANDSLYTFAPPDASSNFPAEGSTLRGQHKLSALQTDHSLCADTASRDTTMNGRCDNERWQYAHVVGPEHEYHNIWCGAVITNTETTNPILLMKEAKEATEARAVERAAMVALAKEINFKFTSPAKLLSTSTTEVEIGIWSSWGTC